MGIDNKTMTVERTRKLQFEFRQDIPYEVVSEKDETVLVAICPKLSLIEDKEYLVWFDTVKDRIKEVANVVTDTPESLSFTTPQGEDYFFRPLTYSVFQTHILPHLHIPQNTTIQNQQAMITVLMDSINYE